LTWALSFEMIYRMHIKKERNTKIKFLWYLSHTTTSCWYGWSLHYRNFSCNFACSPTSFLLLIFYILFYCKYHKTHGWAVHKLIFLWRITTEALKGINAHTYEVVSKILRIGAAIYTAVVVAWSTGPNRTNCEFWDLLPCFVVTAWKRAKTLPQTLARTDLATSSWQCPVSHFHPHPAVSGETWNGYHPPPTVHP
jgi:hypothetical protein